MKTAYEKWLIMKVKGYPEDHQINELAVILQHECSVRNTMAFDLVDKTGDKQWTVETFRKAAKLILSEE